ncbi:MAG: PLP-dependent aminotransferase family protein [Caldisericia bacterium]
MFIPIDRNSSETITEQIVRGIKNLISDGYLKKGSKLPSTRELANSLSVNRNTVVASYDLLIDAGIIESQVGMGTVVVKNLPRRKVTSIGHRFPWADSFVGSSYPVINSWVSNSIDDVDKPISFLRAYGGNDDLKKEYIRILTRLSRNIGLKSLSMTLNTGYAPLINELKKRIALSGVDMRERSLMITPGGTPANTLVLSLLVKPGSAVVIERPTYFQTIRWLRWNNCRIIEVPMTEHGMDLESLSSVLGRGDVKLIYTQPNCHNPTGITTDSNHKRKLLEIANDNHVPILEDNYLFSHSFVNTRNPSLCVWDKYGSVISTSSISKFLGQSARLGFISAPERVIAQLEHLMCFHFGPSNALAQMALYELITSKSFSKSLERWTKKINKTKNLMIDTLKKNIGEICNIWTPDSLSIWIETPGISGEVIAARCAKENVHILQGSCFVPESHGLNAIRLSLTEIENEKEIIKGASVISKAILSGPESIMETGF